MNSYSEKSREALVTCDPKLQNLFYEVLKDYDHSILEGYRGEEEQSKYFREGKSKVEFPFGKHNQRPSKAVHAAPYPVNFSNAPKNIARFYHFAGFVKAKALQLGIPIRWGGDWNSNNVFDDQNFDDLCHFEMVG